MTLPDIQTATFPLWRMQAVGLADRDYMKAGYGKGKQKPKGEPRAPLFKQIKFLLYRLRRALSK